MAEVDRNGGIYNDQPVSITILQLNVVAFSSAEFFELKTVMACAIKALVADVISCLFIEHNKCCWHNN